MPLLNDDAHRLAEQLRKPPRQPHHVWGPAEEDPTPGQGLRYQCLNCGNYTHNSGLRSTCYGRYVTLTVKPNPQCPKCGGTGKIDTTTEAGTERHEQ